ncbi:MAG: TRAP transporter substrate-binding protein DctP [Eubacteriales bacterium]|jgi:TRAP-type C4-dicarboxylate transport system substrate-binding protein
MTKWLKMNVGALALLCVGCSSSSWKTEELPSTEQYQYLSMQQEFSILKVAYEYPSYHPQHKALLEVFCPQVEKDCANLKVELYPESSMGTEEEFLSGVEMGTIEMGIFSRSLTEIVPAYRGFFCPYEFQSEKEIQTFWENNKQWLSQPLEERGLECIGLWVDCWDMIVSNQRATVQLPENMEVYSIQNAPVNEYWQMQGHTVREFPYNDLWNVSIDPKEKIFHVSLFDAYYGGIAGKESNLYMTWDTPEMKMGVVNYGFLYSLPEEQQECIRQALQQTAQISVQWMKEEEETILKNLTQAHARVFETPVNEKEKERIRLAARQWGMEQQWGEEFFGNNA